MKLLAIEREVVGADAGKFAPHLKAEALALWRLMTEGHVREAYFRADRDAAVLVLEATDVEAANEMLATLPLVRASLIAFEVIPLVTYPGFARLFATGIAEETA